MNKRLKIIFCIFILCNSVYAQQPKYSRKTFVTNLDTSEFKITMPKENGSGITYVKTTPPIYDIDDNNTTGVLITQEVVLKIAGTIKNKKKNGVFTTYLMDSLNHDRHYKIWEQDYKNDTLDGQWRTYNLAGKLIHFMTFKKGNKIGIERAYWIDGIVIMEEKEYFSDSSKTIERTYYKNGKMKSEISYKSGIPNGLCKKYYETGTIQDEVNFTNGKFNGTRIYYYQNGKKWIEEEYKNDKHWNVIANYDSKGNKRNAGTLKNGNGTLIFYDDDVTIRETQTFVDGELQK